MRCKLYLMLWLSLIACTITAGAQQGASGLAATEIIEIDKNAVAFVEASNGEILSLAGDLSLSRSADARSWKESGTFRASPATGARALGMLRLSSGKLGLYYLVTDEATKTSRMFFRTSTDEGKSWSADYPINLPGNSAWPFADTMIQLRSGRLLLPVRYTFAHHSKERLETDGRVVEGAGYIKLLGLRHRVETHRHFPEADIGFVYLSDDEGKTWTRSEGEVFGWFGGGRLNILPFDEASAAELSDGSVLMLGRAGVGRLLASESMDNGAKWSLVRPTQLANSDSPCRLRRIPGSPDLLLVWNQLSPDEIRRGYRRGRLSSAISSDGGKTWKHHKTIELSSGLEDTREVILNEPPQLVRAMEYAGDVPDDYSVHAYPNVNFVRGQAVLHYNSDRFERAGNEIKMRRVHKVKFLPVRWFYE